jgi:hypothetical protein
MHINLSGFYLNGGDCGVTSGFMSLLQQAFFA